MEKALTGPRPFHVIDHDGKIVINFDKGGYNEIIDAHEPTGGETESTRLKQARAHHGFAAPVGNGWVTTVASDAEVEGKPYNIAVAGGSGKVHEHADGEAHDHAHSHRDPKVCVGYFEDSQVKDRQLAHYVGDWQSVYPYLKDGTLDPV